MWHYVIGGATIFGLVVKEEAKGSRELLERHATMINLVKAS